LLKKDKDLNDKKKGAQIEEQILIEGIKELPE
jgi:hypothetical protein